MRPDIRQRLQAARSADLTVALVTDLASGEQALLDAASVYGGLALDEVALDDARSALLSERTGPVAVEGRRLFIRVYGPRWRMVVVGAVHTAQSLAAMAGMAGYDVTLVDPRQAFATAERFPGRRLETVWPDELLAGEPPDAHTAIVTLTHDPKIDDPALEVALRSPAFYIGSLGSRKTHALRVDRLRERGFTPAEIERIHAPIGLDLGGRSPPEIAVAILAQVIKARYEPRK